MKSKIVLIVFVLFSVFGFSQETEEHKKEDSKPKHEVRIIMENFFGKNNEADPYDEVIARVQTDRLDNYSIYKSRFIYGLGYNYNFNKIGFRTRGYYNNGTDSYFDYWNTQVNVEHLYYKVAFGAVFQKSYSKLTFFTGLDYAFFKMEVETVSEYSNNISTLSTSIQMLGYKGYSFEPLVGFKYFFLPNFSISSELRFSFDKFQQRRESIFTDESNSANNRKDIFEYDGKDSRIGPNGSISFNIHF